MVNLMTQNVCTYMNMYLMFIVNMFNHNICNTCIYITFCFIVESDSIVDASGRNMTDLKDELVRVCKSLRDARSDKDELRYEVTRLRKLVDKKEKEVEDLLTGGYVGQKDRSRLTGASTKQDNLLVSQIKILIEKKVAVLPLCVSTVYCVNEFH